VVLGGKLQYFGKLQQYLGNLPWYFNPRKCRYCSKFQGTFISFL